MKPSVVLTCVVAILAAFLANRKSQQYSRSQDNSAPGSGDFFDGIAHRYDLLNRIISLGLDVGWRQAAIAAALPASSVLDVSTGTADLAIAMAENSSIRVVGIDPSAKMLARGREKLARSGGPISNVKLVKGVAEALPFESESFEAVIVAFGVRNFQDRNKGLAEMARVLKVGGRLVVLELSMPQGGGVKDIVARIFINEVMPKVASLISGNPSAYKYLSSSMASFPRPDQFKTNLRDAGLLVKGYSRLSPFGLGPDLYTAVKRAKTET